LGAYPVNFRETVIDEVVAESALEIGFAGLLDSLYLALGGSKAAFDHADVALKFREGLFKLPQMLGAAGDPVVVSGASAEADPRDEARDEECDEEARHDDYEGNEQH
jgi:hypothetical protein